MVDEKGPPRKCGSHCPDANTGDGTTTKCRICKKGFHLPCYDVIAPPARLFVKPNIVFICDSCLDEIDNINSPKRKPAGQGLLKQSQLTPNNIGNVSLNANFSSNDKINTKKPTNEQLYALLSTIAKKLDTQTNKINEIGDNVSAVGIGIVETQKKSNDVYNIVHSRLMLREQQDLRDLAKNVFHPKRSDTAETFGPNKERVYPQTHTPKTPKTSKTKTSGQKSKLYSTVVQSKLPVTPQPETSSQRKRETHIALIDNSSSETVKSVKIPTPKQGKKDVQIGRPVEEKKIMPRNLNPLQKSIWISKFHPQTTPDELESYIVENTEVKDKSKFKCIKLVKKDQDVTTMSFVSFKIDVTPEVFDVLIAPENWPQNKHVREFIRMTPPKPTLNDFVPQTPATVEVNPQQNNGDVEQNANSNANAMEITEESVESGSSDNSTKVNDINAQKSSSPKN